MHNGIDKKRDRMHILFKDSVQLRIHRLIDQKRLLIDERRSMMERLSERAMERQKHVLEREGERLRACNPQNVLERGFALITKGSKEIVTNSTDVQTDDMITIRFRDGAIGATVTGKELS